MDAQEDAKPVPVVKEEETTIGSVADEVVRNIRAGLLQLTHQQVTLQFKPLQDREEVNREEVAHQIFDLSAHLGDVSHQLQSIRTEFAIVREEVKALREAVVAVSSKEVEQIHRDLSKKIEDVLRDARTAHLEVIKSNLISLPRYGREVSTAVEHLGTSSDEVAASKLLSLKCSISDRSTIPAPIPALNEKPQSDDQSVDQPASGNDSIIVPEALDQEGITPQTNQALSAQPRPATRRTSVSESTPSSNLQGDWHCSTSSRLVTSSTRKSTNTGHLGGTTEASATVENLPSAYLGSEKRFKDLDVPAETNPTSASLSTSMVRPSSRQHTQADKSSKRRKPYWASSLSSK